MSGRIEVYDSKKEQTSKWSQNESFSVREAGVDIGKDGGGQGGSNVSVDQVVTSGREVAGVTVDGNRTPILVPNEGSAVQSDWEETDPSADDYIKNKPDLAEVATSGSYDDLSDQPDLSIYISDPDYTHTDNNFSDGYKGVIDGLDAALSGKVDKVAGKGLSDNNFTNAQKDKLTNLADVYGIGSNLTLDPETHILSANAQPITIDDEMSSSSTNAVQNKVITEALGNKVDKVAGKVLSDNNFSNADKLKLDGIDQGAEVNDISTISVNGVNVPADSNKNIALTIPVNTSDLNNDSGFITNTANNLANYYLKTDTYTQSEVNTLIAAITTLHIEVVLALPTTDISTTTIYLVPKSTAGTQDVYDEYINLDGTTSGWEHIGSTEVDLTNYYTKTETNGLLADKVDKVTGKGLSTEDYTTAEKTKLAGIDQGAEVNDISTISVNGTNVPADANKNVNLQISSNTFDADDFTVTNNEVSLVPAQRIFTGAQAEWDALNLADKQSYGQVNITDDDEFNYSLLGQRYVSADVVVSETSWTKKVFNFNTSIPKGKYLIGVKATPSAYNLPTICTISTLIDIAFTSGHSDIMNVASSEVYAKDTEGTASMSYLCTITNANNPVTVNLVLIKIG